MPTPRPTLAVVLLLVGAQALAQTDGGAALVGAPDAGPSVAPEASGPDAGAAVAQVAVLALQGSGPSAAQTAPVTALIATRLARDPRLQVVTQQDIATAIGLERQKALLGAGCDEGSSCFTELAGAVGARYVLSGRLDRFGAKWTLTTSLFDTQKGQSLARARSDAATEEQLPEAAERVSAETLTALFGAGPAGTGQVAAGPGGGPGTGADLGIRIGNNFISGLLLLSPSADVVLGYRFDPAWVGFLQVGISVVRDSGAVTPSGVNILPTVLGVRRLYRIDHRVQPYWGVGLGMQLAIGPFGVFESSGPLPSVLGIVGVQWLITPSFGVGVEGSTNLAQTVLGLSRNNSDVGSGFNLKPSLSLIFRP